MGPRHLSRGIEQCVVCGQGHCGGFNGATASEPWNQSNNVFAATEATGLQWGHGI